jgi:hypothetical protein
MTFWAKKESVYSRESDGKSCLGGGRTATGATNAKGPDRARSARRGGWVGLEDDSRTGCDLFIGKLHQAFLFFFLFFLFFLFRGSIVMAHAVRLWNGLQHMSSI